MQSWWLQPEAEYRTDCSGRKARKQTMESLRSETTWLHLIQHTVILGETGAISQWSAAAYWSGKTAANSSKDRKRGNIVFLCKRHCHTEKSCSSQWNRKKRITCHRFCSPNTIYETYIVGNLFLLHPYHGSTGVKLLLQLSCWIVPVVFKVMTFLPNTLSIDSSFCFVLKMLTAHTGYISI